MLDIGEDVRIVVESAIREFAILRYCDTFPAHGRHDQTGMIQHGFDVHRVFLGSRRSRQRARHLPERDQRGHQRCRPRSFDAVNVDTFSIGTISIGSTTSVPEPSSLFLALAGMAILLGALFVRERNHLSA